MLDFGFKSSPVIELPSLSSQRRRLLYYFCITRHTDSWRRFFFCSWPLQMTGRCSCTRGRTRLWFRCRWRWSWCLCLVGQLFCTNLSGRPSGWSCCRSWKRRRRLSYMHTVCFHFCCWRQGEFKWETAIKTRTAVWAYVFVCVNIQPDLIHRTTWMMLSELRTVTHFWTAFC